MNPGVLRSASEHDAILVGTSGHAIGAKANVVFGNLDALANDQDALALVVDDRQATES